MDRNTEGEGRQSAPEEAEVKEGMEKEAQPKVAWIPRALVRATGGDYVFRPQNPYDVVAVENKDVLRIRTQRVLSIEELPGMDYQFSSKQEMEDQRAHFQHRLQQLVQRALEDGIPTPSFHGVSLEGADLTMEEQEAFWRMLGAVQEVFATSDLDLGHTDVYRHHVNTGDARPIKQQPYRVPLQYRAEMEQLQEDMLDKGVIEHSNSPWASPVVLVKKYDGKLRFCVDYRKVNYVTRKDSCPMPRGDDYYDQVQGRKYFSVMDMQNGYWQIDLTHESRAKSAFSFHRGLYQFRQMPFGLTNAPATFQRLMEWIVS